jgi:hypothetical protein
VCDKEVSTPPTIYIPVGPRSLQGVNSGRVIPDPVYLGGSRDDLLALLPRLLL